ncbi:MAG: MarR family transcriptional regulator [Chloroflexi bacterium]|nr:MarR family transcriptional regulator [Chloroflexota bacterium]MCC6892621.1 MarR family transcriptional regulator [Anaerolineae bacterium]
MKTRELTESQITAWTNYQRMRLRLTERMNRQLTEKTGLSEADFEILTALTETPAESVRAIALRCGLEWEKSRLSHQLKRMEARGLVMREDCVEDNRGAVIRATELGRKLAAEARVYYEEDLREYVIDVLSPDQLDALGDIAETILSRFEKTHKA